MKFKKGKFVWDKISKNKVMVQDYKNGKVKVTLKDKNGRLETLIREAHQLVLLKKENKKYKKKRRGYNKYFKMVKQFHKAFGHPVANSPTRLDDERKKSRIAWMQEELNEYKNANTLYDEIDALIDLEYFILGTLVEHGVEPDRLFKIIHSANMKKLFPDGKPRYDESGKVIKPEGWKSPDELIKKEIDRQINRSNKQEVKTK